MSRILVSPRDTRALAISDASIVVALVLVIALPISLPAHAAQPPIPEEFTVTVNRDGGGNCTKVRVRERYDEYIGDWTEWSSGPIVRTYDTGVDVDVEAKVDCPCAYKFDKWTCEENSGLDGTRYEEGTFWLTQDTTATAVFEERLAVLTIYVEDPTPGDSDTHTTLGNVGHTFWKLTGGCVSAELQPFLNTKLGFYPAVNPYYGLPKTWLTVDGALGDDSDTDDTHDRPYIIDYNGLIAALELTKDYYEGERDYDVLEFNCTDAAFAIMAAAGIEDLPNAHGECDCLTHEAFAGNCPGILGENLGP